MGERDNDWDIDSPGALLRTLTSEVRTLTGSVEKVTGDHENRLRRLEERMWQWMGGAAVIGALVSAGIAWLYHLTK